MLKEESLNDCFTIQEATPETLKEQGSKTQIEQSRNSTHLNVLELLWIYTNISGPSAHSGPGFISLGNGSWSRTVMTAHVP